MNSSGREDRLIEIWADPQIKGLARRMAGNAETADDALQLTYVAIVRRPSFEEIENLRAYFVTVLRREIQHIQGQWRERPTEDAGERRSSPSFESNSCSSLDARARYERFMAQRDRLLRAVPARSNDPGRYRSVVRDAAGQILWASVSGEPSEADSPAALRAAYPEYFADPGAAANTCDQRGHRARHDVRELLKAVVTREELSAD